MSRLDNETARAEDFFRSLFDHDCPVWSKVLFVENMLDYRRGDIYKIPRKAFLATTEYEPQFESLLNVCFWINFNVVGIFQDALLINLEYPRDRREHGRREQVSINLSGPTYKSAKNRELKWDLASQVVIVR